MTRLSALFSPAVLANYWEKARTSIWLIPTALCLLAALLAVLLLYLDRACTHCVGQPLRLEMDVVAARDLMGVLATSFLSVGGVSFSVTMVALTLTSGQYGPKVLRHFLEDTRNKLSMGLFFATAVYALAVSISLDPGDQPQVSVLVALALALLALIEFIGFIHRTAFDLQADQLIQRLGSQLRQDMRRLSAEETVSKRNRSTESWRRAARSAKRRSLPSEKEGYIQTADYAQLAATLARHGARALLRTRPGDFVVSGTELMALWFDGDGDGDEDREKLPAQLQESITVGPIRTPIQDPEFPITQVQQIAARALSTGINDPGTAITCIDWLTVALAEVVDRDLPGRVVADQDGEARLLIRPVDFAYLMQVVYPPLRQFTTQDLQVCSCLLASLERLAALTQRPDRLSLLRCEGEYLWSKIESENHAKHDAAPLKQRFNRLRARTAATRPREST